jgi:hypothetical protein
MTTAPYVLTHLLPLVCVSSLLLLYLVCDQGFKGVTRECKYVDDIAV